MRKYYEAYDERYKMIHEKGYSWAGSEPTPVVMETIKKYGIAKTAPMLEIGCGEGRDAGFLLKQGYNLTAADVSPEAVSWCRKQFPACRDSFRVMDCLKSSDTKQYAFIYSVAVIHMLVKDEDRNAFFRFVHDHLSDDGIALICSMGDGMHESMSDIDTAFVLQERDHPAGKVLVAGTSLRMVSFPYFISEMRGNGMEVTETGITSCIPEFRDLMYAVVRRRSFPAGSISE